jgi:uncharacterized protein
VIYLDSSALLKLVIEESESAGLERWILERAGIPAVSSELAKIEVIRACRRVNAEALPEARMMIAGIDLIPLTGDVVDQAAEVGNPLLRSMDAIHLVSALSIRADLSAFVAYDHRLIEAASAAGLMPHHPGA